MSLSLNATSTRAAEIYHHTLTHSDGSVTSHYTAHVHDQPERVGRGDTPVEALTYLYLPFDHRVETSPRE